MSSPSLKPIVLSTHPKQLGVKSSPIVWGAKDAKERGPVVGSTSDASRRNVIGTHNGSYAVYRAVAKAAGKIPEGFRPDLENTDPVVDFPPQPSWFDPDKIVSIDPWGHLVGQAFKEELKVCDIRPTIAITKAHICLPELGQAVSAGRLAVDGSILKTETTAMCTKIAVEHVWHLPGVAKRFGVSEGDLRRSLFQETGGMFPELITRSDLDVFLPPIGGLTVYIFGDPKFISDPTKTLAARVHDECNGSDVFGSDICTCRPYLIHGMEVCIKEAQNGGVGLIAYFRKEGRALGEVTKFLVYNARKRQEGGDRAETYFLRTECVAGVQDMRFQELMPDILHWLGVTKIDRFVSMSDMKYDAIVDSGIEIKERVAIPPDMIPPDAHVEIDAKKAAGYFTEGDVPDEGTLRQAKGRPMDKY